MERINQLARISCASSAPLCLYGSSTIQPATISLTGENLSASAISSIPNSLNDTKSLPLRSGNGDFNVSALADESGGIPPGDFAKADLSGAVSANQISLQADATAIRSIDSSFRSAQANISGTIGFDLGAASSISFTWRGASHYDNNSVFLGGDCYDRAFDTPDAGK